jgi:transcription elongation factor Elf1
MADVLSEVSEIKETDIVFDCPHCGKSLAIDYRGAGLTIPCTDCGKDVEVPIPEGMELTDIDSSDEEKEIRILNLRRSLAAAEFRVEQLETQVAELNAQQAEKAAQNIEPRLRQILEAIDTLDAQQEALGKALAALRELAVGKPAAAEA